MIPKPEKLFSNSFTVFLLENLGTRFLVLSFLLIVLRQAQPFDSAQGGEPVEPDGEQPVVSVVELRRTIRS